MGQSQSQSFIKEPLPKFEEMNKEPHAKDIMLRIS